MEKTRTSDKMSVGEKVFVFIAVMALVACVTGLVAVGLTSMASWTICMTLGGLIVGWIVCIIGMTLYSSKNDPAAGICMRLEPTTNPPTCRKVEVFKECFRCGKTVVVEVAENVARCDATMKNIKAYCPACAELIEHSFCSFCGAPQPPPTRMIKDDQVRDQRYIYPEKCPHCGAPSGKSSAPDKSIEPPKFERYKETHS